MGKRQRQMREDEDELEEEDLDDLDGLDDEDDDEDLEDLDDEDDAFGVGPVADAPPPPPLDAEETGIDAEFDEAAKKRKDKQTVDNFLLKKKTAETTTVSALTDLLLQGESDKLVHELASYCSGNNEIKKAKQLLREARDRAKARIIRLAGVAALTLDELKDEYDD